jgi:hypothetical protein
MYSFVLTVCMVVFLLWLDSGVIMVWILAGKEIIFSKTSLTALGLTYPAVK